MKEGLKNAAIFLAGAAVGGAAVYFSLRKLTEEHYSQIAADDIASVKEHYRKKEEALEKRTKDEKISAKLEDLGYLADTTAKPNKIHQAVWTSATGEDIPTRGSSAYEDDYETADLDRDLTQPHLISMAEHDDNDEFDKIEIVYYEADDTLADEDETEIVDTSKIVGEFDPSNFGHIPAEPHLMIVRNPTLRADYTITRDTRSYTKVILGFEEPEDKPPIRKMRHHE